MKNIAMQVGGMSCGGCVRSVTNALAALEGVQVSKVEVGSASVAYDPNATSPERIGEALEKSGYTVRHVEPV